ncbi:hypothetical protein ACOTTU_15110 [Roseobacter sp. EG26]|uniref:hypothetical protein n=1 Tax=Roseobacter sp. EG26 TaxID=3412477 RepID=UPI00263348A5|nr:hypothetical protein [uncultured Roseobacter sp.]
MIRLATVMMVLTLAACGADGEPIAPRVNGGVTIDQNGIYPSASVGLSKGPLSLWLGL